MKCSIAAASALAVVVLAKPQFTNSNFAVEEGQPFTLTYTGCEEGCTIVIQHGSQTDLKDVKTLTTDATGGSTTITLEGLPSDTYNFKITDKSGNSNYSQQFPVEGTGEVATPSPSGTASPTATGSKTAAASGSSTLSTKVTASGTKTNTESTGSASTSAFTSTSGKLNTATASSTGTSSSATSSSSGSSSSSTISATKKAPTTSAPATTTAAPSSTKTAFERTTSATTRAAVSTTPPGSGAGQLSSPMALVAGVVMAVAYLS